MMKLKTFFILLLSCMTSSYAQSKLKIILDESETYVKGFVRGQFWARYLDMNQELVLIVKR
jgi:hypothetical protein